MKMHPIEEIVKKQHCIGCGFCAVVCKNNAIEIVYDKKYDGFIPKVSEHMCDCSGEDSCASFCPGENLDLLELVQQKFGSLPDDYLVGHYKDINIGYSNDAEYRKSSSSGGVIPAALKHLFNTKKIDGAYCVVPSEKNPFETSGKIIRSVEEISSIHGSVYHPVNFGKGIDELLVFGGKFVFIGVPCQLEALEKLKKLKPELKEKHVLSIGLFCGGMNKYDAFRYYLKGFGKNFDDVTNINFRHGDWPGDIRIETKDGNISVIPRGFNNTRIGILRYMAASDAFFMLKRCRLCPDQIADLADIAVGDPHLPKYKSERGAGYSIIISRSDIGERTVNEMRSAGYLTMIGSDRDDVVNSQSRTLNNRRHLAPYLKVSKLFGRSTPNFKLDPRIVTNVSKDNYFYAARDLVKIYFFGSKIFKPFYLFFQILDYLFIAINNPRLFIKRLLNISLYLKK